MSETVFFVKAAGDGPQVQRQIGLLWEHSGFGKLIQERELVAVKLHFGEAGGDGYIRPGWLKPIVEGIKKKKGKPFLTDTNTLYRGRRADAVDHIALAHEHGFTMDDLGTPVIIADGLGGGNGIEVDISGKHFKKVEIAVDIAVADAVIVATHLTGHVGAGLAGTFKNVGMGCCTRKAKLKQHSTIKPAVNADKCRGCGTCIKWCPADAISMVNDKAVIDEKTCIGCAECFVMCRVDAVKYNWGAGSKILQEKVVEHALGVARNKEGKAGYMNFLMRMTENCDCMGGPFKPVIDDIGVLASRDPVALEQASVDLLKETAGKDPGEFIFQGIDYNHQLQYAEEMGIGSREYELKEID